MADRDKIRGPFGGGKQAAPSGQVDCSTVEVLLAEAAEGLLSPVRQQQMRDHAAACPGCREKLERARQGREWLGILKQETLEPPTDLVARILAKTSLRDGADSPEFNDSARALRDFAALGGPAVSDTRHIGGKKSDVKPASGRAGKQSVAGDEPIPSDVPVWQRNSVVVLRRTLLEPRLALVAAMAFFSITLTLNLMGVRLTDVRFSDLQPQNLGRAVTRQYAETNARMSRYYENLRIVYEVESRVQQIRRAAQTKPQPQNGVKPQKQSPGSGHSSTGTGMAIPTGSMAANPATKSGRSTAAPHRVPDPAPVVTSPAMEAAYHPQSWVAPASRRGMQFERATFFPGPAQADPQIEFFTALKAFHGASSMIAFSPRRVFTPERRWA